LRRCRQTHHCSTNRHSNSAELRVGLEICAAKQKAIPAVLPSSSSFRPTLSLVVIAKSVAIRFVNPITAYPPLDIWLIRADTTIKLR